VAVAAVADEVDNDVGMEGVAIVGGEGRDAYDSFGVLGVDVEDGDGETLSEIGGEATAVGLLGEGGEPEQVVDDDLDGPTHVVAFECCEIEGFGPDALAGEGGVAMDNHWQDLRGANRGLAVGAGDDAEALLPSSGAAHDDGVGGLEV
jgi:hypothetical protein